MSSLNRAVKAPTAVWADELACPSLLFQFRRWVRYPFWTKKNFLDAGEKNNLTKKQERLIFHYTSVIFTEDANEQVGGGQVCLLQVQRLAPESVLKLCTCFLLLQSVPEAGLEVRTQGCLFQKHRRSARDCAR